MAIVSMLSAGVGTRVYAAMEQGNVTWWLMLDVFASGFALAMVTVALWLDANRPTGSVATKD